MSKTHWKSLTNPNYLGEYSLVNGQDLTVTIDYVKKETITGPTGKKEEAVVAHLLNGVKPFILNKTNMKQITKLTGTPLIENWQGKSIFVYFDPTIKFGRETLGGLRIRPFLPEKPVVTSSAPTATPCKDCGSVIETAFGKPANWVVAYTTQQYGKPLCADCAAKAKKLKEETPIENNQD